MQKMISSDSVIPVKTGIQERKTGFRVKPGMTNPEVLRKWVPDTTWQLGSDARASTILRVPQSQFMQLVSKQSLQYGLIIPSGISEKCAAIQQSNFLHAWRIVIVDFTYKGVA